MLGAPSAKVPKFIKPLGPALSPLPEEGERTKQEAELSRIWAGEEEGEWGPRTSRRAGDTQDSA